MLYLRSIIFHICLAGWTGIVAFGMAPLLAFPKHKYLITYIFGKGSRVLLDKICNIKIKIEGLENIPKDGQFIVASKHQSSIETYILLTIFPKACYVLKRELLYIPVFGWYQYFMQMIYIDRGAGASALKKVIAQAKERLNQGRTVIIFPEGTRLKPGQKPKYQSGIAAIYNNLNQPVLPVALNTGLFWPKGLISKSSGTCVIKLLPIIQSGLAKPEFMRVLEEKIESHSNKLIV